jgi:hypothetical protein
VFFWLHHPVYLQKQRDVCFRLWLTRPCGFYLPKYCRWNGTAWINSKNGYFLPNPVKCFPNASMNVFPTPGTPVIPIRMIYSHEVNRLNNGISSD